MTITRDAKADPLAPPLRFHPCQTQVNTTMWTRDAVPAPEMPSQVDDLNLAASAGRNLLEKAMPRWAAYAIDAIKSRQPGQVVCAINDLWQFMEKRGYSERQILSSPWFTVTASWLALHCAGPGSDHFPQGSYRVCEYIAERANPPAP